MLLIQIVFGFLYLVLFVITVIFVGFTLYICYQHNKYAHIPGPVRSSFYLGNFPEVRQSLANGVYLPDLIIKWKERHGSILVFYLIHRVLVVVHEPAIVKDLLLKPENIKPPDFAHRFHSLFGERFAGFGLFTVTDHTTWHKRRKIFNPAFSRKYLMGLMDQFNQGGNLAVQYLQKFADGTTSVKMADECDRVTLDILGRVAFGMSNMKVIENPDNRMSLSSAIATQACRKAFQEGLIAELDPRKESRDFRRNTRSAVKYLRKIGRDSILERIKAKQRGEEVPEDILTHILSASHDLRSDREFGLEEMVDEFITFFVAGQETTGNLLGSALLCLGRFPEIMKRVKEEVDAVVGKKEHLTYQDITKLEYTNLVLKETLRYHPPAAGVHKVTSSDLHFGDYKIPAGTFVLSHHYGMGRDERFFPQPDIFDPLRFKAQDGRRMYAYFPFALGPRSCIGQNFAMIEARVILAKLIQNFNITLVPGQSFDFVTHITTKPKDRTQCYITSRL